MIDMCGKFVWNSGATVWFLLWKICFIICILDDDFIQINDMINLYGKFV